MADTHTPTALQARKQQCIDAYIAARIRHMEATQAATRAAIELGATSARMEMHWWQAVPEKYRGSY